MLEKKLISIQILTSDEKFSLEIISRCFSGQILSPGTIAYDTQCEIIEDEKPLSEKVQMNPDNINFAKLY